MIANNIFTFIFGLIFVLNKIEIFQCQINSEKQASFNSALSEIIKARNQTSLNINYKQSHKGKSSVVGVLLNDLTSYSLDFMKKLNSTSEVNVESTNCPFKPIQCNSTYKYQSFDGICNNLKNPLYGSANTPYKRILSPVYADGISSPRVLGNSGKELPNPRVISLAVSPPIANQRLEFNITHLFPIFGQFLTHDISGASAILGKI